jgi:uncharacterized membrane protein
MIEVTHITANPIVWASQSIRPVIPQVSIAITSSLLAVFGGAINGWFKLAIKRYHFIVRVFAFVMLVAFGYGALNLALAHLLSQLLITTDDFWLSSIILVVFMGIGLLAEEQRQI